VNDLQKTAARIFACRRCDEQLEAITAVVTGRDVLAG
jgi:hypothetical protein